MRVMIPSPLQYPSSLPPMHVYPQASPAYPQASPAYPLRTRSWVLWEPKFIPCALSSMAIIFWTDQKQLPLTFKMWVLPLTMYFSGARTWCLSSLPVFYVLFTLSGTAAIASGSATAASKKKPECFHKHCKHKHFESALVLWSW